jgi:hypothetical protein
LQLRGDFRLALSGSLYQNVGTHWRVQIEWTASQNITGNYSVITAYMYWIGLDSYATTYSSATKDGGIEIGGGKTAMQWSYFSGYGLGKLSGAQKKQVGKFVKTIYHDDDGTATLKVDGFFDVEMDLVSAGYVGRVDLTEKSFTLNTIPRASSLNDSTPNWTAGGDVTLSISTASGSFRHEAEIYVLTSGGAWDWVKQVSFSAGDTSQSTSFSTAEKQEIFRILNGASSARARVVLQTFSGSTHIGTKDYDTGFYVTVPSASLLSSGYDKYVYVNQTITAGITRYDSEFTHTAKIYCNGTLIKTITGIGTSLAWTPTTTEMNAMYAEMPNSTVIDGNIQLFTYYGSELVRNYTNNDIDFYVPTSDAKPKMGTGYTYKDILSTTVNVTQNNQYIIQNKSRVRVEIPVSANAEAQFSSTMKEYTVFLDGMSQTQAYSTTSTLVFDFNEIGTSTNATITIRATDSRGISNDATITAQVIPYSNPTASVFATRQNNFEQTTTVGMNDGGFSSIKIGTLEKNGISISQYRYKKKGATTYIKDWTTLTPSSNVPTNFYTVTATETLNELEAFEFEFKLKDALTEIVFTKVVSVGQPIFFIDSTKKSVGVNKLPQFPNTFEVTGDIRVYSDWGGMWIYSGGAGKDPELHLSATGGDWSFHNDDSDNNQLDFRFNNSRRMFLKNTGELWVGDRITASGLNLTTTSDAGATSETHAFTIGNNTTGQAIKMDANELSSFADGQPAGLHINPDGGIVTFNNSVPGFDKSLTIELGHIVNENRIGPSLQNGWINYAGAYTYASYWKDKNGVVHMTGLIRDGRNLSGSVLFQLPVGYRPHGTELFVQHSDTGDRDVRVDVDSSGYVKVQETAGGWVSLAGMSFKAEN